MTRFVGNPLRGTEFANAGDEAISARVGTDSYPRVRIDAGGRITWSAGTATGDTTLYRSESNTLVTDDVFKALQGVVTVVTDGVPTQALPNGAIAIDTTNNVFYYRSDATWLKVSSSSITVSDTEPASPDSGSMWFDSTDLQLYIYYGSAWVQLMPDTGAEDLVDLIDVNISMPVAGQFLKYDGTEWINSPGGSFGTVDALNDITDVTITSATSGQFLKWNGTAWINDAIDLGADTTGNYMSAVTAGTGISVTHTPGEGSSAAIGLNATLDNLSDVTITSPTTGQIIKWNGTAWVNDADAAGSAIDSLDDVTDVTITSATSGQFLKWNGSAWINDAIDLATDTTGSFVQSLVAGTGVTLANNSGENATPTITVDTSVIQARVTNVTDVEIGYLDGVTSAIQTQFDAKLSTSTASTTYAPIASPTFTGTVSGVTATMVGLGSVDNTADTAKPVSTAQQTALDLKANLASPTFTGTVTIPTGASITAPTGLVKGDVGLGNVDNTADTAKPVSTAQQTALDLKANLAGPTFTGTVTVPTPIGNTDASTKAYVDSTASTTASNASTALTNHDADTTNIHGIADTSILVTTTGSQTLTNKTITTPAGLVKGDVGLGNVDNTSDANKPVSTAGQTALDLKANLASPTFTGTVTLPDNTVALGTKTTGNYVESLVAGTGITLSNNSGESATPTIAIGQAVATNSNVTFNDLIVSGNLTVSGTTTSINTETLTVDDNIIVLNNNVTSTPTENAGIEIERGTSANVLIRWNETNDKWELTNDGTAYSDIATASSVATATTLSVDNLTDATITSAAAGQFLKYNGSAWVNDAIDLTTDTVGDYVATLTAGTGITLTNNSGEGASPTVTVDTTVIQAKVTNVTDTEIGYLDGVTSAIQTQLDTKASTGKAIAMAIVFGG